MKKPFALLALVLLSQSASADSPYLPNKRTWDHFWPGHAIVNGILVPTIAAIQFAHEPTDTPRWRGGILLDDITRDAMRAPTLGGRQDAAVVSDYLLATNLIAPAALAIAHGDHWFNLLGYLEAAAWTQFFVGTTKRIFARKRPGFDNTESFISGHAGASFVGAGAICGMGLPESWGASRAVRWTVCGTALSIATTVAALRVVGDKHYLSDVSMGAGVGLFFGWFYSQWAYKRKDSVRPIASYDERGFQLSFQFAVPK
jgi:membrane-associated phospholipid phosphatase